MAGSNSDEESSENSAKSIIIDSKPVPTEPIQIDTKSSDDNSSNAEKNSESGEKGAKSVIIHSKSAFQTIDLDAVAVMADEEVSEDEEISDDCESNESNDSEIEYDDKKFQAAWAKFTAPYQFDKKYPSKTELQEQIERDENPSKVEWFKIPAYSAAGLHPPSPTPLPFLFLYVFIALIKMQLPLR